jgi:hypothetical protein
MPLEADSSNGAHLLYRVDLPNDKCAAGLLQRCLQALAFQFSNEEVAVDLTTYNAARICKLYGTLSCKGDSTPDRPHRLSRLLVTPCPLVNVPRDLLEALASLSPPSKSQTSLNGYHGPAIKFDLEAWIAKHSLPVASSGPWKEGGKKWVLNPCPWNPEHDNRAAFIVRWPDGTLGAGCHHNGCAGKDWHALRDLVEPGWRMANKNGAADTRVKTSGRAVRVSTVSDLLPYKPFPTSVLPQPAGGFVVAAAKALGCDESFLALPLLTALAAAIGNTRSIQLKRTWSEPAVLWTGIVGESGTLKSPALDAPLRPVFERQARAFRVHKEAMEEYKRLKAQYDAETRGRRGRRRNDDEPAPVEPELPVCERFVVGDTTVEALAHRLSFAPRGLLLHRDELSGWLSGFNQYKGGKGSDIAHWLTMHGARNLIVDRRTGDKTTMFVPRAAVCVTGGIQPATLRRALTPEFFENGLAARLLLTMPPRKPKRWTEAEVDQELEADLGRLFERLWCIEPETDLESVDPVPRAITLTPDGREAWINFYNRHALEQAELSGDLAAAWSKLEGYCARLALLIHLIRWATLKVRDDAGIDAETIAASAVLTEWFAQEARRVYIALGESDEQREHRELVELIRAKGGQITVRDLMRCCRRYQTADAAEQALAGLVKDDYADRQEQIAGDHGGWSTTFFRLKPSLTVDTRSGAPEANGQVSTVGV